MLEYSELPPLSRVYHEAFLISADTHAGENPPSAAGKLPAQPVGDKDLHKPPEREDPSSEPKPASPGQQRPKKIPTQLINPDPILPALQIKITQDFQAKVIVYHS